MDDSKAMSWWKGLSTEKQDELSCTFNTPRKRRNLTDRHIRTLYKVYS